MNAILEPATPVNPLASMVSLLNDLNESSQTARVWLIMNLGFTSKLADQLIAEWLYSDNT
jgi:hypothetical protein